MNKEVVPHWTELTGTLILVLPASRNVRDKFALFLNHPVYDTSVEQPKRTKIGPKRKKS